MLVLSHDTFFGDLQLSRALDGITLSHRIANSPPARVPMHTHSDAHFVLVTSGDYVSSAKVAGSIYGLATSSSSASSTLPAVSGMVPVW